MSEIIVIAAIVVLMGLAGVLLLAEDFRIENERQNRIIDDALSDDERQARNDDLFGDPQ